ncbi:MAG: flagellar hook-length control protein FliK, partial [Defluviitaleaceae bacterium]|nr:flagellar hook-length control protein FliK [Defluviitaleaceae bacterium]
DVIIYWLAVLNILPSELTEPQNTHALLQALMDISEPAQMLAADKFFDTLRDINAFMAQFKLITVNAENGGSVDAEKNMNLVQFFTRNLTQSVNSNESPALHAHVVDTDDVFDQFLAVSEADDNLFETQKTIPRSNAVPTGGIEADPEPTAIKAEHTANGSIDSAGAPETAVNVNAQINFTADQTVQITPSAAPQQAAYINTADVVSQIISRFSFTSAEQFMEIKLTLRPANLGDVSLKVATVNGLVTAQFVAENQRIREIIEANFNQLRDALQRQGVSVSELSVSVQQDQNTEQMNRFLMAQQSSRARMNDILQSAAEAEGAEQTQEPVIDYNTTVNYLV